MIDSMSDWIWTDRMISDWTARDLEECGCVLIQKLSQHLSVLSDDSHNKPQPRLLMFSQDSKWALYEDKSTQFNNYTHLPDIPVLYANGVQGTMNDSVLSSLLSKMHPVCKCPISDCFRNPSTTDFRILWNIMIMRWVFYIFAPYNPWHLF